MPNSLTPKDVAATLQVKTDTVLAWIAVGELTASDVSRPTSTRPRWRIMQDDLVAFLSRRRKHIAPAPQRRRKPKDTGVIAFYT